MRGSGLSPYPAALEGKGFFPRVPLIFRSERGSIRKGRSERVRGTQGNSPGGFAIGKSFKAIVLVLGVLIMLLFGLVGIAIGAPSVANWASLSGRYIAYYGISLLAGLALLIFSALALRKAWRRQMTLCGLAAAAVLVLNQFLGLRFEAILCFTPS